MNDCRIWKVCDGEFSPFEIIPSTNSKLLASAIGKFQIPENISIYLRGSYLENDSLFKNSDIDLVIISENVVPDFLEKLKSSLAELNRPVEILCLSQSELQLRHTHRLLLHTRSLHIAGPKIKFFPVKANLETMQDHYFHYKPHMMSANLSMDKNVRITQLKQITRAYGILYFMFDMVKFSRDISTCLNWAVELDSKTGLVLKSLWNSVDNPKRYKRYSLNEIKSSFLEKSQGAINYYNDTLK
jgi:hypothetical protein